jgi:hypothetical protein
MWTLIEARHYVLSEGERNELIDLVAAQLQCHLVELDCITFGIHNYMR